MVSAIATQALTFVVNLGTSYLLGRIAARDGQKLDNLAAAGGDYGVPMPRAMGEKVRLTGIFIAQDDIKETKHTVEDHSEIIGVVTGAAQGFMVGGPIGAVVGGAIGGLLGFAAPDQKYYTYSDTLAWLLVDRTGDDPIEGVDEIWCSGKRIFKASQSTVISETLDADGKLISRKYGKNKYLKSLTVYGGHTDQAVDPILAAQVEEDSAYIFSAYVVLEDLQLAPFGNSVPPGEALTRVKASQSLADAAELICAAGGIDPERDMSSTALVDYIMRGFTITGESSCFDALKPLLPVFGIDCAEVAGQIRFFKRSQTMRGVIPSSNMGAYVFGDSGPDRFVARRSADLELPQETSLTWIDPERAYQPNSATSRRSEGDARSNISASVQVVMTADEGASAAALMHWDAWLGRTGLSFALTDRWNGLAVGHAYGVPIAGQILPYRITRTTRGANGIIEVEALSDESVTYTANVAGSSGIAPDDESTLFPETRLILIDDPILEDAHDDFGFYAVIGAGAASWTRGRIEVSSGANFVTIIDSPLNAVMGDVTGTLAAGSTSGLDDELDTTSVLTVVLLHDGMELESATDAELDAYKNFGFVGKDGQGEYLQWKTPTKIAPRTWQLTNLRRGRKGTDYAIATHAAGEEFAQLGGEGVFRIVYSDESQWGETLTFRGVTLHQDGDDAASQVFANSGEGKRPYSPIDVEGVWDGSNNLTVTFTVRSRLNAGGLGIDDRDEYEVEFLGPTPRSVIVTDPTAPYSAVDQTSDGITPGDSVSGRVRQLSDVNDGRWRNFTIVGPLDRTADTTIFTADSTTITADMA